jgi:putative lipase involved disintegration of autophagic bodies
MGERGLKMTPRYKKSKAKLEEIKRDFPDAPITLSAHSLGGSIAYTLGHQHGIPSYSFNAGSLKWIDRWNSSALDPKVKKMHKIYHTDAFDVLSFTSQAYPATHHTVPVKDDIKDPGVLKAHSIEHFY